MNNVVINGEYKHHYLSISKDTSNLILEGSSSSIELSKDTVNNYEIKHIEYKRNIIDIISRIIIDIISRNIIGIILVGPPGLLAGFTASNTSISYNLVYIEFKDGKKSLIKIDKNKFKALAETVF